jgi:hypothetical protein
LAARPTHACATGSASAFTGSSFEQAIDLLDEALAARLMPVKSGSSAHVAVCSSGAMVATKTQWCAKLIAWLVVTRGVLTTRAPVVSSAATSNTSSGQGGKVPSSRPR